MAGNDWVNSYLEAILDVGPNLDDAKSSLLLRERGRFSPTRYFVAEVITGYDETDLHRSWVRVRFAFSFLVFVLSLSSFRLKKKIYISIVDRQIHEWLYVCVCVCEFFKAAATRSPQERNTRLENMCWRIWNLARKKKQVFVIFYFFSFVLL